MPGLRYDRTRLVVPAGAEIHLSLKNTDTMLHNLVIVRPGTRIQVVQAALLMGAEGPERGYVPSSTNVLFSIPALNSGATATLNFKAPGRTGIYPYVCTYPGHGFIMYGALYVGRYPHLPALAKDPHLPHLYAGETASATNGATALNVTPPALYRIYMPNASPAAIAVYLPGHQSYCWDAARCRLRYAWSGGFINPLPNWVGNGSKRPIILGKVYYRATAGFPLRLGNPKDVPKVNFLGYRLLNRYPEFHYQIDGVDVRQLITTGVNGEGINQRFILKGDTQPVWYLSAPQDGVTIQASTGKWEGDALRLTPVEARRFAISITKTEKGETR